MTKDPVKRNITIYGLISYYGSYRAKICAGFLCRSLPHLYNEPKVEFFCDLEFKEKLAALREEVGKTNRRIWSIRYPVLVFFNNKYVGDHRAIIKYLIREHKLIPDLPFVDIFPDFKTILPQKRGKDYVFLDVRIGTVTGSMVFELDTDICPATCKFFKNFCKPKIDRKWGDNEKKTNQTYIGSHFRRIYGRSLVQGGQISNCNQTISDENYAIKHDRRGLLSLANDGQSMSTSEFCISFKENPWMNRINVAFGRLIFGEHLLAVIEKVPTYYQSPLIDIYIIGAGVIPSIAEWDYMKIERYADREQVKINKEFTNLERKRLLDIRKLKEIVKNYVTQPSGDELIEYGYHYKYDIPQKKTSSIRGIGESYEGMYEEEKSSDFDRGEVFDFDDSEEKSLGEGISEINQFWGGDPSKVNWLQGESTMQFKQPETETVGKLRVPRVEKEIQDWVYTDSLLDEETPLVTLDWQEIGSLKQKKLIKRIIKEDFTLEEIMEMARKENSEDKKKLIVNLVVSVLRSVEDDILRTPPSSEEDILDVRDVPSDDMTKSRFEKGLYSLPGVIQHELVKRFRSLSPSYFARLHSAVSLLLMESIESEQEVEEIHSRVGSEGILSGILMAVWNAAKDFNVGLESVDEVFVDEVFQDMLAVMRASRSSEPDQIYIPNIAIEAKSKMTRSRSSPNEERSIRKTSDSISKVSQSSIAESSTMVGVSEEQEETSRLRNMKANDAGSIDSPIYPEALSSPYERESEE